MLILDFTKVRAVFGGSLTQPQVDGLNLIMTVWNEVARSDNAQQCGYVLATAKWETAHTMQPLKETGTAKVPLPPDEVVIARLDKAFKEGKLKWVKKPYWRDGWFGRGFAQLTHEFNYKGKLRDAVLKVFGIDIHADRDQVLNPPIAAFILVWGMGKGIFTGKSLDDYIDDVDEADAEDYKEFLGARHIINGVDRQKEIAQLALAFEACLLVKPIVLEPLPAKPIFEKKGWWQLLLEFLHLSPKKE